MTDGSASIPVDHGDRPRVVVVGAGFSGLEAARKLAQSPVDVTVIDRRRQCRCSYLVEQRLE